MILRALLSIIMGLGILTGSIASDEIRAVTGPPQLNQEIYSPERMYRLEKYLKLARDPWELLVPITKWPEAFREDALIGLTGHLGKQIGFAVQKRAPGQYIISIDLNMNGDLRDDPVREMIRTEHGYVIDIQEDVVLRFVFPEKDDRFSWPVTFVYKDNYRSGLIHLADRQVPFVVRGSDSICFDLDGDGTVEHLRTETPECYQLNEQYAVIDGSPYSFEVQADGSAISMKRLSGEYFDRPSLAVGTQAPNFDYVDQLGRSRALSDHLGQVVLLYGWHLGCGPCRSETQALVKLYEEVGRCGFEIVGINKYDSLASVLEYTEHHGITWPQTLQGADGPVLQMYRIRGTPFTMLIDQYGVIQARQLQGEDLKEAVQDLIEQGGGPCAVSRVSELPISERRLDEALADPAESESEAKAQQKDLL